MSLAGLLIFSTAYALAVASPGPGIASVVAQVLGRGIRAAPPQIAGILAGDFIWFIAAVSGLAALAHNFEAVFILIKWLGAAYLLYLAFRMWTSPVSVIAAEAAGDRISHGQLFLSGLTLTLSNPKAIAFFLALLPAILDLQTLNLAGFLTVAALIVVILPSVLMAYAIFAHAARGFFRSPRALRNLNRVSGAAIAGAAVAIAARR